jgi:hypothetical protein
VRPAGARAPQLGRQARADHVVRGGHALHQLAGDVRVRHVGGQVDGLPQRRPARSGPQAPGAAVRRSGPAAAARAHLQARVACPTLILSYNYSIRPLQPARAPAWARA